MKKAEFERRFLAITASVNAGSSTPEDAYIQLVLLCQDYLGFVQYELELEPEAKTQGVLPKTESLL